MLQRKDRKTGPSLPLLVQISSFCYFSNFPASATGTGLTPGPSTVLDHRVIEHITGDINYLCQRRSGSAFTASSAGDYINNERLAIQGDAFLKFVAPTFLFKRFEDSEDVLATLRSKMVGNRKLYYCGTARGLRNALNREIINLHIGQAGCDLGSACWELYCFEHGVEPNGLFSKNLNLSHSFFNESQGGKAVPRAAFFDHGPSAVDDIRVGDFRHLFKASYMLNGKEDAASCFVRGFDTLGKDLIDPAIACIRNMAECCSAMGGFLIFRSYGGGTGSGFTARLLEELSNDFPKVEKLDFSVFLSPKLCSLPVEPYNGAFALHHSQEFSGVSFIVDNEACYDICDRLLNACAVTYRNINRLLAHAIASVTSPFRFDDNSGFDINELKTNLLPLPRLQYPIISCAPLISKEQLLTENITESSIINSCFQPANQFVKTDLKKGLYMTCTLLFRGNVNHYCVNTALQTIKEKKSARFVKWSPLQFKVGMNSMPSFAIPSGDIATVDKSCAMLSSCTHVKSVFQEMSRKFDILYSKKAFVHWFIEEGLEEGDFHDTRLDLSSLISEYSDIELEK